MRDGRKSRRRKCQGDRYVRERERDGRREYKENTGREIAGGFSAPPKRERSESRIERDRRSSKARSFGLSDKSSDISEGRDPPSRATGRSICIGEILTLRLVASGRSYRSVVQFSDHLSHDYPGSRLRKRDLSLSLFFFLLGNGTLAPRHNPPRPLSPVSDSPSRRTHRPVLAFTIN